MKNEFWSNGLTRTCIFKAKNKHEMITVFQSSSIRDRKLEPATINWVSPGSTAWKDTLEFYNALSEAIAICKRWNQDAGKILTDLLSKEKHNGK